MSTVDLLPANVIIMDGKIIANIAISPIVNEITYNNLPLPTGSVLRDTVTHQKFLKITGDVNAYFAIPIVPKAVWDWALAADAKWEVLNNK